MSTTYMVDNCLHSIVSGAWSMSLGDFCRTQVLWRKEERGRERERERGGGGIHAMQICLQLYVVKVSLYSSRLTQPFNLKADTPNVHNLTHY